MNFCPCAGFLKLLELCEFPPPHLNWTLLFWNVHPHAGVLVVWASPCSIPSTGTNNWPLTLSDLLSISKETMTFLLYCYFVVFSSFLVFPPYFLFFCSPDWKELRSCWLPVLSGHCCGPFPVDGGRHGKHSVTSEWHAATVWCHTERNKTVPLILLIL